VSAGGKKSFGPLLGSVVLVVNLHLLFFFRDLSQRDLYKSKEQDPSFLGRTKRVKDRISVSSGGKKSFGPLLDSVVLAVNLHLLFFRDLRVREIFTRVKNEILHFLRRTKRVKDRISVSAGEKKSFSPLLSSGVLAVNLLLVFFFRDHRVKEFSARVKNEILHFLEERKELKIESPCLLVKRRASVHSLVPEYKSTSRLLQKSQSQRNLYKSEERDPSFLRRTKRVKDRISVSAGEKKSFSPLSSSRV